MALTIKHLPADQRRAVTVAAVLELAAEQNPSEITTAAIAQRMNLTQGALFRHFSGKEAIWQAVMEWVSEELLVRLGEAAQGAASPLAALEAIFLAHLEFVGRFPGAPRIIFGELQRAGDTPAQQTVRRLLGCYAELLSGVIAEGQGRGELAREVDVVAAATLFIGTIQGLVMQALLTGDIPRMRGEAPGVFALYRRGITRSHS
ncbi:MAG: TetR/AcrR family transcriptional regulator [Desulfobulbaceae bacterium]|nr:TetR/AcrR family transcriptional regulator [Desulfobulbaceae bacterium]